LAIQEDARLFDVIALIDAIRKGRVRKKAITIEKLKAIFKQEYAY